ncbi:CotS family spore coat protein, partial [Pradoshia sp.]
KPSSSSAYEALAQYPFQIKNINLWSMKRKTNKKAVWAIETEQGDFIIKKVPLQKERIEFMVHAIDYLRSKGVHTPYVVRTRNGDVFATVKNENFIIFEAIHGRTPDYTNAKDLKKIMEGLAQFHKSSTGFKPSTGEYPSFLLDERKLNYHTRYDRLFKLNKERSNAADLNEFDELFLANVDTFLKQGDASLSLFNTSDYEEWANDVRRKVTLCHQDYAEKNLLITDDSVLYVFDMDSLTVDLPIRDIRKILNKVMKKQAKWDIELMIEMLKNYQKVNPLTEEQYKILVAELSFPHLFYDQATTYYYKRQNDWTEEKHINKLREMILTEKSKEKVLKEFIGRIKEVVK